MGAGISGPLVMPAWCDPQSRHFRPLGWFDTLVGLLMVDDERFVFATPSGVEFNALRSEARLKWRRGNGFGTIPKFDLSIPQGSFRLYLSRPGQGAPQCGRRIAAKAGEQLSRAGVPPATLPRKIGGGELGGLFTDLGGLSDDAFSVFGFIGAFADLRQQRRGRDAARALRAMMSAPLPGRPSAR